MYSLCAKVGLGAQPPRLNRSGLCRGVPATLLRVEEGLLCEIQLPLMRYETRRGNTAIYSLGPKFRERAALKTWTCSATKLTAIRPTIIGFESLSTFPRPFHHDSIRIPSYKPQQVHASNSLAFFVPPRKRHGAVTSYVLISKPPHQLRNFAILVHSRRD
jgi:hypothetical protein